MSDSYATKIRELEKRLKALEGQEAPQYVGALNVGAATGAPSGDIKVEGKIQPGNVAVSYTANLQSVVNNGVIALGMSNFGFAFFHAGGNPAWFAINGSSHTTTELSDPSAVYSNASGTATSINVYWSAANSRYEVENKRGSTLNIRIWLFDAA